MKFFLPTLVFFQYAFGSPASEQYFAHLEQLDLPNGDYREGEIEIVTDPAEISEIQKAAKDRLLKNGFSAKDAEEFSRIGIISEDHYWIWIRDAVYFPYKAPGTYDRLLWKRETQKVSGVAIFPILPSGQIVLVLNYRHATRSWELELPRATMLPQETFEETVFRELKNETGFIASSAISLGEMTPDTGVLSSVIPVFMVEISAQEEPNPDYSEAIAGAISCTKEELKKGFVRGFLELPVNGKIKQVPLRDPFLTFALFQAECRGLL